MTHNTEKSPCQAIINFLSPPFDCHQRAVTYVMKNVVETFISSPLSSRTSLPAERQIERRLVAFTPFRPFHESGHLLRVCEVSLRKQVAGVKHGDESSHGEEGTFRGANRSLEFLRVKVARRTSLPPAPPQ